MSLFGSLEIGKKSLSASQLGQSVSGHNIANVDTKGFSRQETVQAAGRPHDGKVHGVDIQTVRRIQDGFTKQRVVAEQNLVGSWDTREAVLSEAEVIYSDLEGNRLRGQMDEFWSAWKAVSTQPESVTMRKALLSKAENMTDGMHGMHERLSTFRSVLNQRIKQQIQHINQTTRQIAQLNTQVEQLENRGLPANDARDQREALLQDLSKMIDLDYYESPRKTLEIQLSNGMHLVHGRDNYQLHELMDADDQVNIRVGLKDEIGMTTDITDKLRGGTLKEYFLQRDETIKTYRDELDDLAREIGWKVNRIHSTGTGIESAQYYETSLRDFKPEDQKRPIPFLESGVFEVKLLDQQNEFVESIAVNVDAGVDTIETIVEKINRAAEAYEVVNQETGEERIKEQTKFKAQINEDGSVTFNSGLGNKFIYGQDDSGVFAALGLNCFFNVEKGASDIHVNSALMENEMKIATGTDLVSGDNTVAQNIALLQQTNTMRDESVTFDQFFNSQITDIGLKVEDAVKGAKSHKQMLEQYESLRDSVSSVNLDEEMANMIKYQRAYESSAKFLSTVDQMTQTVINM